MYFCHVSPIPDHTHTQNERDRARSPKSDAQFGRAWKSSALAGYIGISGPYNLAMLKGHLVAQGLDLNGMVDEIFECNLDSWSPSNLARGNAYHRHASVTKLFPPVLLLHGTADR